jgi:serine/threonine protein kinase/Tol biopolymer transport system component
VSLTQGSRVGRYEIQSLLGEGGMGEVYRAHDEKLGREVAIKVLPTAFAADTERLARFEREARTLAALNHPNIAAIYEIAESNGVPALILELIEGETLEERLTSGSRLRASGSAAQRDSGSGREPGAQSLKPDHPHAKGLSIEEALRIALQIADALEAAHDRGIVHRDLKPANVKLTPSGIVKLLDFGLAKPRAETPPDDLTRSPTKALNMTEAGAILGTVTYMSPEQTRGLTVTRQSDVWAFGCVLYEMLAGKSTFAGETTADIFVSILQRTPDWTALPAETPPAIRRLLQRCLEKDPRRRLRDVGDARLEIEDALQRPETVAPLRSVRAREVQFSRLTDFVGHKESPAISPDGKMVAFVAMTGGRRQIWVRMLAGGAALQVTRDPVDHEQPRWVPDSSALIYFTRPRSGENEGSIWQISALGGPARRVVSALTGGDISRDGQQIAVFQDGTDAIDLVTVSRDGSRRAVIARLSPENLYRTPRWSPDDRSIAFQVGSIEAFELRLEVINVEDGDRREIARGSNLQGLTWKRDGSGLVYASSRGSTLLYPPVFNLRTVDRSGHDDRQLTFGDISYVEPDIQAAGVLVACRSRSQSDIWRLPITGTPVENTAAAVRITHQNGHVQTPSVSPDGSEVVYLSDNGGHANLWVAGTDGTNERQITFDHEPDVAVGVPYWSPSGEWIVFIVSRAFRTGLAIIRPDGSDRRPIGPARAWHASWSSDGRWVYYSTPSDAGFRQEKAPVDGGSPEIVLENVAGGIITFNERTKYVFNRFTTPRLFGRWSGESEVMSVGNDGSMQSIIRISGARVPVLPLLFAPIISPDGEWLAIPLTDGATTNIWGLPTSGGPLRPLTDFGNRSILIARSVSWAHDSQSVYAAVAEVEADVVLFDGLVD